MVFVTASHWHVLVIKTINMYTRTTLVEIVQAHDNHPSMVSSTASVPFFTKCLRHLSVWQQCDTRSYACLVFLVAHRRSSWCFIHVATWSCFPHRFCLYTAQLPSFFPLSNTLDAPFMFSQTRPFLLFASSHRVAVLPLLCFISCLYGTLDWPLIKHNKAFILYLNIKRSRICG